MVNAKTGIWTSTAVEIRYRSLATSCDVMVHDRRGHRRDDGSAATRMMWQTADNLEPRKRCAPTSARERLESLAAMLLKELREEALSNAKSIWTDDWDRRRVTGCVVVATADGRKCGLRGQTWNGYLQQSSAGGRYDIDPRRKQFSSAQMITTSRWMSPPAIVDAPCTVSVRGRFSSSCRSIFQEHRRRFDDRKRRHCGSDTAARQSAASAGGGNYQFADRGSFDFGLAAGRFAASPGIGVQVGISTDLTQP